MRIRFSKPQRKQKYLENKTSSYSSVKTNYFYSQRNYPHPRTAIEAKILFAACVMQVQFLKLVSGKTPREQSSSGKKIGAESAVLHFVFIVDG